VASVEDDLTVTCSRKVRLVADRSIKECAGETFDLIALPVSAGPAAWVWRWQGCRVALNTTFQRVCLRGHLAVSYC
jgi:hypothetical protein